MADDGVSDWAKWQHAENVLVGYRAFFGGEGYEPPASPGSAREFSYRAGWLVACFDKTAAWLRAGGLHCRVRGEEHTEGLEIIGGTEYEPEVREGIGMFTGVTFLIRFDGEGHVLAEVCEQSSRWRSDKWTVENLSSRLGTAASVVREKTQLYQWGMKYKVPCTFCGTKRGSYKLSFIQGQPPSLAPDAELFACERCLRENHE